MRNSRSSRMLVVGALALTGCVPLGRGRSFGPQVVAAKTTDGYLIAAGGDKCRVATAALAAASVGSTVRCLWVRPNNEPRLGRPALPRPTRP
jgi:hypothetical protein